MKDKVSAILLAAGRGIRMRAAKNKAYLTLLGKPVIYYPLHEFQESSVDEIILVVEEGEEKYARRIVSRNEFDKVRIVTGGYERFDSVMNGLEAADNPDYVLIHDGARAFIKREWIEQCIRRVKLDKACIIGTPVKDTIKVVNEDQVAEDTPDRSTLWQVQTPQCFSYREILDAYRKMYEAGDLSMTDDGMVMEAYGTLPVRIFAGSYENIKITTPEDMVLGEAILLSRTRKKARRYG